MTATAASVAATSMAMMSVAAAVVARDKRRSGSEIHMNAQRTMAAAGAVTTGAAGAGVGSQQPRQWQA